MVIQIMTLNISATVGDRDMMSTDDQLETTNCGSSGHVTDDVKLPERVKVATPKCLRLNILVTMRDSYLASTDHQ